MKVEVRVTDKLAVLEVIAETGREKTLLDLVLNGGGQATIKPGKSGSWLITPTEEKPIP